jgi:hypothetical protein
MTSPTLMMSCALSAVSLATDAVVVGQGHGFVPVRIFVKFGDVDSTALTETFAWGWATVPAPPE